MNKLFVIFFTFSLSIPSFGVCFDFVGNGPQSVGPVKLFAPAKTICKKTVSGFAGMYYSLQFSDQDGDLAHLASKTEVIGRCPGFCREYTLLSGNANGEIVNPDHTKVIFQVERFTKKVTISHPSFGTRMYNVTELE